MLYSGRGWVALMVFLLALAAGFMGADAMFPGQNYFGHHPEFQILLWAVAGAIVFALGRAWNANPAKELIARDGRPEIRERARHTLYRIPMEWWGPIFFVGFTALSLKTLAK